MKSAEIDLSICIPTFNRLNCLKNCLNSIYIASKNSNLNFEVCISDNNSLGNAQQIINHYKKDIKITYRINKVNIGLGKNIVNAVSLSRGEFAWIIGNDDLMLPNTFKILEKLFKDKKNCEFFFINSFHLNSSFVFQYEQPFDTNLLPKNMEPLSKLEKSYETKYLNLIDRNVSFDFMLGMFLSIFKRKKWIDNLKVLNPKLLDDSRLYSNFDNTCPHAKIFSSAFSKSNAWFQAEPLSINLKGEREWGDLYPLVESIRIPELIDNYRFNGLPFLKYLIYKNHTLRKLIPSLFRMVFLKEYKGLEYINFKKHILKNIFFPSIYLGGIYYVVLFFIKSLSKKK